MKDFAQKTFDGLRRSADNITICLSRIRVRAPDGGVVRALPPEWGKLTPDRRPSLAPVEENAGVLYRNEGVLRPAGSACCRAEKGGGTLKKVNII